MKQEQCFAYFRGECRALKIIGCEDCVFCKAKEQLKEERKLVKKRLRSLSQEQQVYIYEKYYGGDSSEC